LRASLPVSRYGDRASITVSGMPERVRKVICYVMRDGKLLVFRHRDHPQAGIQVPAGTVRHGEEPASAAARETEEETGRTGFVVVRELGVHEHEVYDRSRGAERHELHERHVFQLDPPPDLPAHWSHLAEPGEGDFWFEFSWSPLGPGVVLAGDQHAMLSRIKDRS
jgi:8-oxo-dGTP pyrophosphatase MutT (NUDIX family)